MNNNNFIKGRRLTDKESNLIDYPDLPILKPFNLKPILKPFNLKWYQKLYLKIRFRKEIKRYQNFCEQYKKIRNNLKTEETSEEET